jgi:hypothetical protein
MIAHLRRYYLKTVSCVLMFALLSPALIAYAQTGDLQLDVKSAILIRQVPDKFYIN